MREILDCSAHSFLHSCRGSLGLTVTVVVNVALAAFNFYQRRQIEQQQRQGGCAHARGLERGRHECCSRASGPCVHFTELPACLAACQTSA